MKNCPKCGCDLQEMKEQKMPEMMAGDDDAKAKDEVLAELIEMMQGSLGKKLGKPAAISVEMTSVKPKKDDDEEEGA